MGDGPNERPTAQLPRDEIQTGLLAKVESQTRATVANTDRLADAMQELLARIERIEPRVERIEERQQTHSDRVRQVTDSDLSQQAQIAEEIAKRVTLEKELAALKGEVAEKVDGLVSVNARQVEILESLQRSARRFFANPIVKAVGAFVWTALIAWLARKGVVVK